MKPEHWKKRKDWNRLNRLKGGGHRWDGRYSDPVAPVHNQPLNEDGTFKIGKYRGQNVNTVPKNYCQWVLDNWVELSNRHKRKLKERLNS